MKRHEGPGGGGATHFSTRRHDALEVVVLHTYPFFEKNFWTWLALATLRATEILLGPKVAVLYRHLHIDSAILRHSFLMNDIPDIDVAGLLPYLYGDIYVQRIV